jgi:hypothetical protein
MLIAYCAIALGTGAATIALLWDTFGAVAFLAAPFVASASVVIVAVTLSGLKGAEPTREPLSEDGYWPLSELPDWMDPDPTTGAEKVSQYRRTGGF